MAAIDTALILALVRTSRLHGLRLMVLLTALFYFIKTLTSTIEAAYFMPNVSGPITANLLLMTVPLTACFMPLAVWLGGRAKAGPLDASPGFVPLPMPAGELIVKILLLSAIVYPLLFFGAGWFIAFRSAELREFYGGTFGDDVFRHLAVAVARRPTLYPLEVVRGALWITAALPLLRTTHGPRWLGTLLLVGWFVLIQNDVHLLSNPLMTPTIRAYHFVETAASNAAFALCIGWLLNPPRAVVRARKLRAPRASSG
jgi:hypothetical protein